MVNPFPRLVVASLAASLAVALPATGEAKAPQSAKPALWVVTDPDTTIYLFGTIHLLPQNYQWRTPKFDQAVTGSHQLVVETVIDDKNPTALMSTLTGMAFAKGLPPIADRVPPQKRAALEAAMLKSGIPRPLFDQMETWAAAFMLLGNQFKEMGLKGAEGVEAVLRANFIGAGKPIGQLETNAEQLGFFDALPEYAQRSLLEGAIEKPADMSKEFEGMLKAWAKGDVEAIARTFDKELAASPELKEAVISRRNANWSKWIERRMAQPGVLLIAVGAGHLAGRDSVIELLKKQGYRVDRLQ